MIVRHRLPLCVLVSLLLAVAIASAAGCTPPLISEGPVRFFALNLPKTTPPADLDGQPIPGLFLSARLLLDDRALARSQTIVGEMDQGQHLTSGHSLGMTFMAPRGFMGVAVSLSRVGPGPTNVHLALRRGGRKGSLVAERRLTAIPQRGWAELRTGMQPAGQYYIELADATGEGVYWRGLSLGPDKDIWQGYRDVGVPFKLPPTLADIPSYDGGSLNILVNTQAERIYILGGRSSYDYGIARWGDYEVRSDSSDRQFIGDKAGELEVDYADGTSDHVPLIFGFNQWWWTRWGDVASGGPFLQPFATTPRPLIASLHVYSLDNNPLAPSFWVYQPQKKMIARLRLVDNPQIQGFPLVAAITLEAYHGGPNATELPMPAANPMLSRWLAANTITPEMITSSSYEPALQTLRDFLYTNAADIPSTIQPESPPGRSGPRLSFDGPPAATILSNVYEFSLQDMLAKLDADGAFHASTDKSPNFGLYGGIGTWRAGVGYFYNQAWSRDMGRTLLEMIRLGFLEQAEAGLGFAGRHLYDLFNGYPQINRNGQRVPPHWGTVLGQPNLIDVDGMGDDNQENDGHGLLLLAYVRAWQARGRAASWLDQYWQVIRDASEWYCFQLENPSFSRATKVLYTEGEAANGGGYDVYSNDIAVEALRGTAQMARERGDVELANRWDGCADTISRGMMQELTDRDSRYGVTWRPVAWDWGYGHESLAPAFITADLSGYVLTPSATLTVTQQTYRRQVELIPGFRSGRVLGYGQAFLTQAALLLDDMTGAGQALNNMASFIYDAGIGPYLVPEGVALHPSGGYWYRTGDLGNAEQEAEVLKALALVAGVDDLNGRRLTIIPRVPLQWTGVSVSDYPVTVLGQRLTVGYTLKRAGRTLHLEFAANGIIPLLDVRLGPLPADATPLVSVGGVQRPAQVTESGGSTWVWLRDMTDVQSLAIDVQW